MHQKQGFFSHIPIGGRRVPRSPETNNVDWNLAIFYPQGIGISDLHAELVRQAFACHGFYGTALTQQRDKWLWRRTIHNEYGFFHRCDESKVGGRYCILSARVIWVARRIHEVAIGAKATDQLQDR